MPITATLAIVATAAMAGVPLLNGFLSKEMFFAETIFAGEAPWLRIGLPAVATLASVFSVAYSLRLVHRTFFGPLPARLPRKPHDPNRWMLAPSALLVSACILVGILPAHTVGPFLAGAARALLGADVPEYSLAVWHGLTLPLIMSVVALVGGIALYALLYRYRAGALAPAAVLAPYRRPPRFRRHHGGADAHRRPAAEHLVDPPPAAAAGVDRLRRGGHRRRHRDRKHRATRASYV